MALLAFDLARNKQLPIWVGIVLVVGAATTIYLTPVLVVPGLAWLMLGAYLWWAGRPRLGGLPVSPAADP